MKISFKKIKKIMYKFKKNNYDLVLGISRGGVIPATLLSYKLGLPLLVANIKTYDDKGRKLNDRDKKIFFPTIDKSIKRILIVDDISDTGETLDLVYNHYNKDYFVHTLTLFYKPHSKFKPDYYYKKIGNSIWVDFPWEG